jgi:arylsulfatase A
MKTCRSLLLVAVAAGLLDPALTAFEARAATTRPNIIFVLFDDLGWAQPQCYDPQSALRTPNLDRLAREGMRFTDAHSASAVCTPTRYGVLTGRYPWRIGQYGVLTTFSPPIIPPSRLTVASLLKQQGYTTACIGKWHLGLNWVDGKPGNESQVPVGARLTGGPNAVGFDYFHGFTHARNIGTIIEQDRAVEHVAAVENQPRMIARALEWIAARKANEPFFLYFPMCPPHTPVAPAPEFIGKSGARDVVKSDPKYGDWVYQGDHMLGQLLDALEKNGHAANTLVIVTADNGAEGRAYAPLRESKRSIYEGGHRVPFIVRWPGKVKLGSVNHDPVCLNDFMATAADLTGAQLPAGAAEDSVSLLPSLLGQPAAPRDGIVHQSMSGDLALRRGDWKLVFHKDGRRELFNLASDLGETRDVLAANGETAAALVKTMERFIATGRSTPGAPQANGVEVKLPTPASADAKAKAPGKRKKDK